MNYSKLSKFNMIYLVEILIGLLWGIGVIFLDQVEIINVFTTAIIGLIILINIVLIVVDINAIRKRRHTNMHIASLVMKIVKVLVDIIIVVFVIINLSKHSGDNSNDKFFATIFIVNSVIDVFLVLFGAVNNLQVSAFMQNYYIPTSACFKKSKTWVSGGLAIVLAISTIGVDIYSGYIKKISIDPFSDCTVTFSGINGEGYVKEASCQIDNKSALVSADSGKIILTTSSSSSSYSHDEGLSNGDKVEFKDVALPTLKSGYKYTRTTYEAKVEGLKEPYKTYEEVPEEIRSKAQADAEERIKNMSYVSLYNGDNYLYDEKITGVEQKEIYYVYNDKKKSSSSYRYAISYIYEVKGTGEKVFEDEVVDGNCFVYIEVYIDDDDEIYVQSPSSSYKTQDEAVKGMKNSYRFTAEQYKKVK